MATGGATPGAHVEIRRIALVTNPAAGKGSSEAASAIAQRRFADRGVDVDCLEGSSPAESQRLAARAVADPRIDALVACGGDGLLALALQEQAESETPLGIVPAGTGNDHAREYGIPTDPAAAADVVVDGWMTTTDLGRLRRRDASGDTETRWFGTIACAGFDSLVTDRANSISWPTGRMRYNLAIVLEFLHFHSIPTRLVLDHERVLEDHMTLVAVGNTRSYGGGMLICPDADPRDGLLDITVLERMGRFRAAAKFGKVFSGDFLDEVGVSTYRARHVSIEMAGINGYADGDPFGLLPMEIEIVEGAGRYLVPRG